MSLGLFGIQAKWVTSLRRESSLQRFYRCSDLTLRRNESKMAKVWAERPHRSPTLRQRDQQKIAHPTAPRQWGKAHQEVSFAKTALNSISNRDLSLQGSSRWWFCRQHSPRPHSESLCSSLRFNPDMCAERWAGGLKHVQKYARCPKSTNQPHINMTHSCQQHPILPSRDLLLCQSLSGPQRTRGCLWQVPCPAPPSRLLREGKGEADNCSGAWGRAPCCPGDLNVSSGHAWCPILATEEGPGQSCLLRGCFVQCLI